MNLVFLVYVKVQKANARIIMISATTPYNCNWRWYRLHFVTVYITFQTYKNALLQYNHARP